MKPFGKRCNVKDIIGVSGSGNGNDSGDGVGGVGGDGGWGGGRGGILGGNGDGGCNGGAVMAVGTAARSRFFYFLFLSRSKVN